MGTLRATGGWMTPDRFNSLEEVREKLALLEEFKMSKAGNPLVIREYEVLVPIKTRQGIVGEQLENQGVNAGKRYIGGGIQIEFGGVYNPYDPTGNSPEWKKYFKDTEIVGNIREYIQKLE